MNRRTLLKIPFAGIFAAIVAALWPGRKAEAKPNQARVMRALTHTGGSGDSLDSNEDVVEYYNMPVIFPEHHSSSAELEAQRKYHERQTRMWADWFARIEL